MSLPTETEPTTATEAEIARQPAVWRQTSARLAARRGEIDAFLERALAGGRRVILTGAGTSAFIGDVVAAGLARATRLPLSAVATTTLVSNPRLHLDGDPVLLVSFARSGASPESLAATRLVDELAPGSTHLVITCDPAGPLARAHADRDDSLVLPLPEADDTAFAMTSSFTAMLLSALLVFRGGASPDVAALADAASALIAARRDIADEVDVTPHRVVWLGSGPLAGLAREAALKQLELTGGTIPSFFESSLGFRHGPKAVLDASTLAVVFLSSDDYTRQYDEDIAEEIAASPARSRVITVGVGPLRDGSLPTIPVDAPPQTDDEALAAVFVIIAQVLAVELSRRQGIATDNPFPSGDVNRVVRGVTIHALPTQGS